MTELEWTALVKADIHTEADILWFVAQTRLDETLAGRAPAYTTDGSKPWIRAAFAVEGATKDEAAERSEVLMTQALGNAGLTDVTVNCVSVEANKIITQDIQRIDESGHMRPEADVIQFAKPGSE